MKASSHIHRCAAAIGPVWRPPNPFAYICLYGKDVFLNSADTIDAKFSTHDPWRLGHICGYWRSVAAPAQELWSTFRHECSSGAKLEGEGVELASIWLARAGSRTISVKFTSRHHRLFSTFGLRCPGIFAALVSRNEHWKNAHFVNPGSELPAFASVRNRLSNLEDLYLCLLIPKSLEPSFSAFLLAPRLHTVHF
ncbi:hypothetical protein C8J57DRAFT_1214728 [Mycena rebaudengoi]|nr:hypothetical protein C8J57DRAFT_1214728 [Mycena rebaudengoi]